VRVELAPPVDLASAFVHLLREAEVPATTKRTEAEVLWSKLVRLAPLALSTAASGLPIGAVLDHPRWRALLQGAVDETAAVARADGFDADAGTTLGELDALDPGQTSSLARDVEARAPTELDAIGGAVLRAGDRHAIATPAVAGLVRLVGERLA
jgi:2-dehydropantoate 2-reductase